MRNKNKKINLKKGEVQEIIFGLSDGLTVSTGISLGALAIGHAAVVRMSISLMVAQVYSMSAAERMSEGKIDWHRIRLMALVSAVSAIWVALPFFVCSGTIALVLAACMWLIANLVIGKLRDGKFIDTLLVSSGMVILTILLNKFL